MFADFNIEKFPIIKVKFSKHINEKEFNEFLSKWLILYQNEKKFTFIFDTRYMGFVNPKYIIKIASFIKELKKLPIQYLEKSFIIMNNKTLEVLLKLVFSITSPTNAVYLVKDEEHCEKIQEDIKNNIKITCTHFLP